MRLLRDPKGGEGAGKPDDKPDDKPEGSGKPSPSPPAPPPGLAGWEALIQATAKDLGARIDALTVSHKDTRADLSAVVEALKGKTDGGRGKPGPGGDGDSPEAGAETPDTFDLFDIFPWNWGWRRAPRGKPAPGGKQGAPS